MALVNNVVQAVVESLQSIAGMQNKTFHVITEEEVMQRAGMQNPPAVGIIYSGMTPKQDTGPSHRTGAAVDINIVVLVFYKLNGSLAIPMDKQKADAIEMLDTVRKHFLDTTSPTGKSWRFMGEQPALEKNGVVVWVQRWSTPGILS